MSDFITISGWGIGLIGLVLAIVQGIHARKEKVKNEQDRRSRDYLFELAEKNIDKNISDKQIKELETQLNKMNQTIQQEIPLKAQKIALSNIIDNETELLSESYTKLVAMKEKLAQLSGDSVDTNDELMKSVFKQISPTYSQRRNQQGFSNGFIIISIITSIISFFVSYEYTRVVLFIALAVQLIFVAKQAKLYLSFNYSGKEISRIKRILYPASTFIILFLSTTLIISLYFGSHSKDLLESITALLLVFSFWVAHVYIGIVYSKKTKSRLLPVWLGLSVLSLLSVIPVWLYSTDRLQDVIYIFALPITLAVETVIWFISSLHEYYKRDDV